MYVASYDGDQFDPNLLPEDRNAINAVQSAIQEWGKLVVVYQPSEADMIILVTSRPSEDLMAVYDARPSGNFLWRVMGRDGLQAGETLSHSLPQADGQSVVDRVRPFDRLSCPPSVSGL